MGQAGLLSQRAAAGTRGSAQRPRLCPHLTSPSSWPGAAAPTRGARSYFANFSPQLVPSAARLREMAAPAPAPSRSPQRPAGPLSSPPPSPCRRRRLAPFLRCHPAAARRLPGPPRPAAPSPRLPRPATSVPASSAPAADPAPRSLPAAASEGPAPGPLPAGARGAASALLALLKAEQPALTLEFFKKDEVSFASTWRWTGFCSRWMRYSLPGGDLGDARALAT